MESRLKEIVTITDVQSATENNDPNQDLNKQGSYTAAVYFADNEVTNPVAGADLVAKGMDAGGCVEVYKTAEDAKKRNDYLSAFDGLPKTLNSFKKVRRILKTPITAIGVFYSRRLLVTLDNFTKIVYTFC